MEYATILTAIGAGVAYSLSSFGKKIGQEWDWFKFSTTVALGLAIGIGIAVTKWEPGAVETFLASAGLVPLIENAIKFVWRKVLGFRARMAKKKA